MSSGKDEKITGKLALWLKNCMRVLSVETSNLGLLVISVAGVPLS